MQVTYNGGGSSQGPQRLRQRTSPTSASPRSPTRAVTSSATPTPATAASSPTCRSSPAARRSPTSSRSAASWSATCASPARRSRRSSPDKITNWNDPAITKDNNGRAFPDAPDHPGRPLRRLRHDRAVHDAGWTTSTRSIWRPYYGRSGLTSYYPTRPGPDARPGRLRPGDEHDLRASPATATSATSSTPTRSTRTTRS